MIKKIINGKIITDIIEKIKHYILKTIKYLR